MKLAIRFRAMEYDETDKWLSLHVLQVMAVPTWSHLNSLPRIQNKFFGDSKAHTRGVYPQREAIHVAFVLPLWVTKVKTAELSCRPLPSIRQDSTIRGTNPPSLI